jgi:hypothetical protein
MTMKDGGPAFPQKSFSGPAVVDGECGLLTISAHAGMSLRDYFAAAALQGYLASWPKDGENMLTTKTKAAEDCYDIADAMLEARK